MRHFSFAMSWLNGALKFATRSKPRACILGFLSILGFLCIAGISESPLAVGSASLLALGIVTTDPKKREVSVVPVTNMSEVDLRSEYSTLLTLAEELEGPDGKNVTNMPKEDLEFYTRVVNRLEVVNQAISQSAEALRNRRNAVSNYNALLVNAGTPIHTQPVVDSLPDSGYEPGPDGETAFLRDVIVAYNAADDSRFRPNPRLSSVVRRTLYNKHRDKSKPGFQKDVWNAVGSDEYSFHSWKDGGLLIPKQYLPGIKQQTAPEDMLSSLCYRLPMEAPELSIRCRVDKNHATSYTGGTVVYRKGEFQLADFSKDQWEEVSFKASELIGATAASKLLMRYSPISLASEIRASFKSAMTFKRHEEFLYGDGNGRPLGIFNSSTTANPCLLEIQREVGQTDTDVINGKNVLRMRLAAFRYSECYWVGNEDVLFHIAQLHIANSDGNLLPITERFWTPGVDGKPDMILGRPFLPIEHFNGIASGTGADIDDWNDNFLGLFNPNEYAYGELYEEDSVSTHVRFLEREDVFLFVKSDDGRPTWKAPLTPKAGQTRKSPAVVLKKAAAT